MDRYRNIKRLKNTQGIEYYRGTKYPEIPLSENDIYVITEWGDRFDQLAFQFYGDVSLWWIITTANPNKTPNLSMFCEVGVQLVIPQNLTRIMSDFSSLNTPSQTALQSTGNGGGGNGGSSVGSSGGY